MSASIHGETASICLALATIAQWVWYGYKKGRRMQEIVCCGHSRHSRCTSPPQYSAALLRSAQLSMAPLLVSTTSERTHPTSRWTSTFLPRLRRSLRSSSPYVLPSHPRCNDHLFWHMNSCTTAAAPAKPTPNRQSTTVSLSKKVSSTSFHPPRKTTTAGKSTPPRVFPAMPAATTKA